MILRELQDSKEEFEELLSMFMCLEESQNLTYVRYLQELLNMLSIQNCKCFMIYSNSIICGFSIIYPDGKGGSIGQSLYIKPQYRGTKLFFNIVSAVKKYIDLNYAYFDLVATNPTISKLYEKLGYKKIYTIYRYKDK